ncbi:hypothetical protein AXG93_136s1180 [Marchantia polymorpha subsp. ruderalis]|uniref:Uncharacterized protein n=1 Tax=Marchantia polymorpha subsp. ruderalis TaxID=1480154 RepID=A0A176W610_MARPO|nr:hypothetical protein AXG93_136s1180 [Marchantia polymorpha subsp. ruderalis]
MITHATTLTEDGTGHLALIGVTPRWNIVEVEVAVKQNSTDSPRGHGIMPWSRSRLSAENEIAEIFGRNKGTEQREEGRGKGEGGIAAAGKRATSGVHRSSMLRSELHAKIVCSGEGTQHGMPNASEYHQQAGGEGEPEDEAEEEKASI